MNLFPFHNSAFVEFNTKKKRVFLECLFHKISSFNEPIFSKFNLLHNALHIYITRRFLKATKDSHQTCFLEFNKILINVLRFCEKIKIEARGIEFFQFFFHEILK